MTARSMRTRHGVERWTSPTTEDVAWNLASSKFHDTSGGSRIRRGVGGCLSERSEFPSPDRAAASPGAEGDSPVRDRVAIESHGLRAKRAGTQAVRAGSVAVPQVLPGVLPQNFPIPHVEQVPNYPLSRDSSSCLYSP